MHPCDTGAECRGIRRYAFANGASAAGTFLAAGSSKTESAKKAGSSDAAEKGKENTEKAGEGTKKKTEEKTDLGGVTTVIISLTVLIALIVWNSVRGTVYTPADDKLRVHFVDVGQGDCTLIRTADAVILVCNSPKSNTAHDAINAAMSDLSAGKSGPIPRQLQNKHFDGDDAAVKGQFYKYPHDYPNRWVEQQYLPDALKNVQYYQYGDNKTEQAAKEYWDKIKGKKVK